MGLPPHHAARTAATAAQALKIADGAGWDVTITAPDGTQYDTSDFQIAMEAGKFDAALKALAERSARPT
jgi:hypothetical protein